MNASHDDPVRTALIARAGDRRRAGNVWAAWLQGQYVASTVVAPIIDEAVREAVSVGRVDRLLLEIMRVGRDAVPSLRTGFLVDQFATEARTEHDAAAAAGQRSAAYPYLNHVDRVRAARLWSGYLESEPDIAAQLVGHELEVAELVGRDPFSVWALLTVACDLVPELRATCLSERFAAVAAEAALDEANLLAGESGPSW